MEPDGQTCFGSDGTMVLHRPMPIGEDGMRQRAEIPAVVGLLVGVICALGVAPEFAAAVPPSSPPVVQDPALVVTGLVERGRASAAVDGTVDQTSTVGATPEADARVALEFQSSTRDLKVG